MAPRLLKGIGDSVVEDRLLLGRAVAGVITPRGRRTVPPVVPAFSCQERRGHGDAGLGYRTDAATPQAAHDAGYPELKAARCSAERCDRSFCWAFFFASLRG